jgi:hypothetical protein
MNFGRGVCLVAAACRSVLRHAAIKLPLSECVIDCAIGLENSSIAQKPGSLSQFAVRAVSVAGVEDCRNSTMPPRNAM